MHEKLIIDAKMRDYVPKHGLLSDDEIRVMLPAVFEDTRLLLNGDMDAYDRIYALFVTNGEQVRQMQPFSVSTLLYLLHREERVMDGIIPNLLQALDENSVNPIYEQPDTFEFDFKDIDSVILQLFDDAWQTAMHLDFHTVKEQSISRGKIYQSMKINIESAKLAENRLASLFTTHAAEFSRVLELKWIEQNRNHATHIRTMLHNMLSHEGEFLRGRLEYFYDNVKQFHKRFVTDMEMRGYDTFGTLLKTNAEFDKALHGMFDDARLALIGNMEATKRLADLFVTNIDGLDKFLSKRWNDQQMPTNAPKMFSEFDPPAPAKTNTVNDACRQNMRSNAVDKARAYRWDSEFISDLEKAFCINIVVLDTPTTQTDAALTPATGPDGKDCMMIVVGPDSTKIALFHEIAHWVYNHIEDFDFVGYLEGDDLVEVVVETAARAVCMSQHWLDESEIESSIANVQSRDMSYIGDYSEKVQKCAGVMEATLRRAGIWNHPLP